jgi:choline dehydrogenase-like flavoprotein
VASANTKPRLEPPLRVLAALARGVLGEGYVPEVPQRAWETVSNVAAEADQKQLVMLLRVLDTKVGARLLTGRAVPVSWLSPAEVEAVVQRWKKSRFALHRQLAAIAISLATTSLYAHPGPHRERIGYADPTPAGEGPKPLPVIEITSPDEIRCDAVIVGSGAGGGCVAAGLAAEGLDVVVLEKGGYFAEPDFHHEESLAMREMYLYGSTLTTADLGCRIIAGSAVGGGTLVNYTTAFRTPDHVLKEWARISGVDAFVSGEIDESLDEVCRRVNVTFDESEPGRRDALMEEGCQKLGWHVGPLPRAVKDCGQDGECGSCGLGCRRGAKQGSMKTFLEDAVRDGARIFTRADVEKVSVRNGRAEGVVAYVNGNRLVVNARAVVIAGGAIETPALLLRSGLKGQVGRNLRLHPGSAVWATFDESVKLWEGTLQARYSSEFAHWDGGYGPLFETVPVHPGAAGAAFPWLSAHQHHDLIDRFDRISIVAVLPRDESAGRISVRRDGMPKIDYTLNAADKRRIVEGWIRAGAVLEAAGATQVNSPHPIPISYTPGPGAHERWAEQVREAGFGTPGAPAFSYHQMGSCRMGIDPATSAIGPDNESHEVKDLFVTDSSAFPTASGVNPMVSVYGIANRAAKKIAARLA